MALINCRECNRKISDQANSCPGCGCPLKLSCKNCFGNGYYWIFKTDGSKNEIGHESSANKISCDQCNGRGMT